MQEAGKKQNGELVFGAHSVVELLKNKRRKVISIYTTKPTPKVWKQVEQLLPTYPINVQYVDREILHKIAGTTDHQNILAWAQPFPYRKKPFSPAKEPRLLLLDGIQDPRNLGAIIRSAYCTGVSGIVMTRMASAPLTAAAHKASAGLAERMELYQVPSAMQAVTLLKKDGYTVYMAAFDGEPVLSCALAAPLCLVIGNEAEGISREVLSLGTQVTIPQQARDVSYNASVAAGILLFCIAHKNSAL